MNPVELSRENETRLGTNPANENSANDANSILKNIRIKNVNRFIIGTLNINSLANKFEQLKEVIGTYLDVLIIVETKLDDSFPTAQFSIAGYKPFRLDRNKLGGGLMVYVREDIPSKTVNKHNFKKYIEGIFIEFNLRKTKLLLFATYHSGHPIYGLNDNDYLDEIGLALDVYSNYDKFLLAGDFNMEEEETQLSNFLNDYNARNLVKDKTCFKSLDNPTCIDLYITNSYRSFQNTTTVSTGLSDFHKMIVTVMKTTFPKNKPEMMIYRDYKKFSEVEFRNELKTRLKAGKNSVDTYENFENIFLEVLNKHAPPKKKILRANHKPYMTKTLRKAIMRRSALESKHNRSRTTESKKAYRKQKNYTDKLMKKEKKRFFSTLDLNNFTDNKKFWNTVKPLFSEAGVGSRKITLVKDEKIISEDQEVAETFNQFFKTSVESLDIKGNMFIQNNTRNLEDPVEKALKRFENHPSINDIKQNINLDSKFSFSKVTGADIDKELKSLKTKKASTFLNIPVKHLKQVIDIISEPLVQIWNNEIIENEKFPAKLKCADISPIHKKLESIYEKNYRPVSILPVVSKIFERIMQKQITCYVEKYLSPYLCGYRKGYNTQYALALMIEKWKLSLDNSGYAAAVFMDLSKAFDTLNHELLIAKLEAYGFERQALSIILNYLTDRWQRTKVNSSFSTWSELLTGVPQGSVLGPLLFNLYINDLFLQIRNTHPCNFADDTSLNSFDMSLEEVLRNLEHDTLSFIIWFEINFMKLNQDKCHFLTGANTNEHLWLKVGDEMIWESSEEKLLGVTIDKNLNFNAHLSKLCRKVAQKVSALARVSKLLPFHRKRLLLKTFIESQFSYCPLIWMFCSRKLNKRIDHIHERALRLVYEDYKSSFEELLHKDKSVTIHHRNIKYLALEMFKVSKDISPPFMKEIFGEILVSSTRNGTKFLRHKVNTVYKGENSLRCFGPVVWNTLLPTNLKFCTSLGEFKNAIKSWVPRNCPCRLCKDYISGLGFTSVTS